MIDFLQAAGFLLILLNPFLVILYLLDPVKKRSLASFSWAILQAGGITIVVLGLFAVLGDAIFRMLLQVHFASFQIFGGLVFLLIGLQFVFKGLAAIELLRGDSPRLAGAIAMPVLIGPGTISASVLVGERLPIGLAIVAVAFAVGVSVITMIMLKAVHDYVRSRQEALVERYIEIAGRVMALFIGTVSVEMIMSGLQEWIQLM